MTHMKTAEEKRKYLKKKLNNIKGKKLNMLYSVVEKWKGDRK